MKPKCVFLWNVFFHNTWSLVALTAEQHATKTADAEHVYFGTYRV